MLRGGGRGPWMGDGDFLAAEEGEGGGFCDGSFMVEK